MGMGMLYNCIHVYDLLTCGIGKLRKHDEAFRSLPIVRTPQVFRFVPEKSKQSRCLSSCRLDIVRAAERCRGGNDG
jgi:hypothetical protein